MRNVDARGKSCPLPIVLLAKTIGTADNGETIRVQANDWAFPLDVKAWCSRTGNELVSLTSAESGSFEAIVRCRR